MFFRLGVILILAASCQSCMIERDEISIDRSRPDFAEQLLRLERMAAEDTPSITYTDSLGRSMTSIAWDLRFEKDSAYWRNTTRSKQIPLSRIREIIFVEKSRWSTIAVAGLGTALATGLVVGGLAALHEDLTGFDTDPWVVPGAMAYTGVIGALIGWMVSVEEQTVYRFP